jgi:hypothetical protein
MTSMNGLSNILSVLGDHPATKWVALALALRALWTVLAWQRCPLTHGRARISDKDAARAAAGGGSRQMWRFVGLMLLGIALAVAGLFRLAADGEAAPFALFVLTGGIYLFTTEPVRRNLIEAQNRVLASSTRGPEAQELSVSMLRDTHVKLVAVEVGIFALIALGMTVT